MPGQTIGYDDLFDFANSGKLDNLIKQVEDLKKTYQEFNTVIKAESDTIKASLTPLGKELDGLQGKMRSLNLETDEGKEKAIELSKGASVQAEEYRKLSKVINDQEAQIKALSQEVKTLEKSEKGLKKTSEQLLRERVKQQETTSKQKKEIRESIRLNNAEEGSLERKRLELSKLKREYAQTANPTDKLKREINQLTTEIKESENAVQVFNRSVGDYEGSIQRVLGSLQSGGGGIGGLIGGSGEGGGISGLLGGLGGIGAALGPLAGLVGAGASISAIAQNFAEVNVQLRDTARLTGLVGETLNTVTGNLRATSKVFEKDYNEVLLAANTLSSEFGISLPDAIEKINEGFIAGNDINGEYLDSLREYSTQIKSAGLSADEFNAIINTSVKEGIFSDKGLDAVKEAGIRLRELTPATRTALDAIGLSSTEIEKSLREGTKSIFDVIQEVSAQLKTLPADSKEVGQAIADIFGGAGEDAGLRYLKILADVNTELEIGDENLSEYALKQKELLESTQDLEVANVKFSASFSGVGDSISTFVNNVLADLLEGLSDLANVFLSAEEQQKAFEEGAKGLSQKQLREEIAKTTEEIEKYKKEQEDLNVVGEFLNANFYKETIAELSNELAILRQQYIGLYAPSQEISETIEESTEENKTNASSVNELVKEYKNLQNILENINQISGEGLASGDALTDLLFPDEDEAGERARTLKEQGQDLLNFVKQNNEKLAKSQEDASIRAAEAEKKKWETIDTYAQEGFFALSNISQGLFQNTQIRLDNELAAVQAQYEQRLELAGDNEEAQKAAEEKRLQAERQINIKRAQAEKRQKLFDIAISTAAGIAKAVAATPLTFGLPFSAFVAAQGAIQAALVASQPLPKFATGVELLEGPGTTTSDSIPALLSKGERVVTAKENKDYYPALTAIHNRDVPPHLINTFVQDMQNFKIPAIKKQDYTRDLLQEISDLKRVMTRKKMAVNIMVDHSRETIKERVKRKYGNKY